MPTIIKVEPIVLASIYKYAEIADGEISGFAFFDEERQSVNQLFPLLSQECTGTETEMNEKVMSELSLTKWSAKLNVWWHSHVYMGVFWSDTDKSAIESLGLTIPYLISIVVNKKREYKARIDWFTPTRATIEDVVLDMDFTISEKRANLLAEEVKKMVKKPKSVQRVWNSREFPIHNQLPANMGYAGMTARYSTPEGIKWLEKYGYTIKDGKVVKADDPQENIPFGEGTWE